MISHKIHFI